MLVLTIDSHTVRVFMRHVAVEKALPFPLRVPNAETRAAMAEADKLVRSRNVRFATPDALFDDLEKSSV